MKSRCTSRTLYACKFLCFLPATCFNLRIRMIASTLEGNGLGFSHIFLLTHSLAPHQHTRLTTSPLSCLWRISFPKKFNPQRETSVLRDCRRGWGNMCPFSGRRQFNRNLLTLQEVAFVLLFWWFLSSKSNVQWDWNCGGTHYWPILMFRYLPQHVDWKKIKLVSNHRGFLSYICKLLWRKRIYLGLYTVAY